MENKATKRTNRLGRGLSALIPDISTEIDKKDIALLEIVATISIDSSKGSLKNNIKELEEDYLERYKIISFSNTLLRLQDIVH